MIEPSSTATAIFDALAARVYASTGPLQTVVVTSTLHGEGSTTVALGIALSLAAYDASAVLLVDANWIRPSLSLFSGHESDVGLAECLRGETDIDHAAARTARRGLAFLPAGQLPAAEVPPFGRLGMMLESAKRRYGKIVIDLPPALVAPSLVVPWSNGVDQTYLVMRRAVTPVALIRRALAEIGSAERPPQLILNRSRDQAKDWGVLRLG